MTTGWTSTLERSSALRGWVISSKYSESRGPSIVRDLFSRLTCTCFWENRMVCARSPVCGAWLLHTHPHCTFQKITIRLRVDERLFAIGCHGETILFAIPSITERILARWLVKSYGLWEYRPWKWHNMSRSARGFVFGFL